MDIYLIRHGESEGNRTNKLQGTANYPLTAAGVEQTLKLAEAFQDISADSIFSSDLERAHKTAEAIANHQKMDISKTKLLREIHLGPLQGKTRVHIYEEFPELKEKDLLLSGLKGTEPEDQISRRCSELLDMLKKLENKNTVFLVSHGGFISIFLLYLIAGENWSKSERIFRINNTGITKLTIAEEQVWIDYVNHDHHLL